jgi:opacity protein-like surface antigen
MKSFRFTTLLLLSIVIAAPVFAADFGIRAGRYNEADEEFVGAEVLFDLGAVNLNPNLEYSLEDDVTAGSANIDVIVDIARLGAATPYVGAGVGMLYADHDLGDAQTDLVGNLIGGVAFEFGLLNPYAQAKYFRVLDDDGNDADEVALTVGLRF